MVNTAKNHQKTPRKNRIFLHLCTALFVIIVPSKAFACCSCDITSQTALSTNWPTTQAAIQNRVTTEFSTLENWYITTLWEDNVLPAMMLLTDQVSAVAMYQTAIIGTFFDAKNQLETQRSLQKIKARAHKDYHPSEGMCEFGSSIKSLAASERKSELTAHIMAQRFQDRMLGNTNSAAAEGPGGDKAARLKQFREKFCDPTNHNEKLGFICKHKQDFVSVGTPRSNPPNGLGATDIKRVNKDIDYLRTVDAPWTLNVDFTDTDLTDNEEEILALADNLYGNDVFNRLPGTIEGGLKPVGSEHKALYNTYMDARAALAKLSVAKNSFNAITSMKAAGTESSRDFMEAILTELGITATASGGVSDQLKHLLGENPDIAGNPELGPSYHAQMEVLTKKIYQNPDFYTNLYDKPANVERKKVAMQAIGLMQKFDMFKSYLRYEASLSVLLELAVVDLQDKIELQLGNQSDAGIGN